MSGWSLHASKHCLQLWREDAARVGQKLSEVRIEMDLTYPEKERVMLRHVDKIVYLDFHRSEASSRLPRSNAWVSMEFHSDRRKRGPKSKHERDLHGTVETM